MIMLKVVAVVDKEGTAIDRLAQGVAQYHTNLNYVVCDVHPKRPDPAQLERFEHEARSADIIDFQYFRSATMLLERYPWLNEKKKILTHYNPYSIFEQDWKQFDKLVACNKSILTDLEKHTARAVDYIPLTVDADFWTFKREWQPNKNVIMVANRIESKKGILPVAIACGDAGLRLKLVGAISDRNYFYEVMQTGAVDYFEQISDEELRRLYWDSTIHVCNSVDNFESGTLPILEAMLCGVPVLTRNVGHVPDLLSDGNLAIFDAQPDEPMLLREKLEEMLSDPKALETHRERAWQTAKTRNNERRAYEQQKLYRSALSDATPVSVVVPIYNNPEVIRACLIAVAEQDYPNLELIVCDDNGMVTNFELVREFAQTVSFPIKYVVTQHNDYGLARARNQGIIEATGEIMVFCDQRQIMEPDCISELVKQLVPKTWVYGNKGREKPEFVENLSAIYRNEIIQAGMFCERITQYGGMTQEVRSRTRMQGIKHVYVETAKAQAMGKSSKTEQRRLDIIKSKNTLFKMNL
jgi:glycosyltransferase involved in cell wall biosynthesis